LGRCVKAEPATRFTDCGVLGLRSSPDAIVATRFDVFSFLAMFGPFNEKHHSIDGGNRKHP
jgi:hypothetical protein